MHKVPTVPLFWFLEPSKKYPYSSRGTIPLGMLAHLTATEAEDLEEAAAPPGEVLDDPAVHVHLELEEVHLLPVGAVQRQHVPWLGHLQQESLI